MVKRMFIDVEFKCYSNEAFEALLEYFTNEFYGVKISTSQYYYKDTVKDIKTFIIDITDLGFDFDNFKKDLEIIALKFKDSIFCIDINAVQIFESFLII